MTSRSSLASTVSGTYHCLASHVVCSPHGLQTTACQGASPPWTPGEEPQMGDSAVVRIRVPAAQKASWQEHARSTGVPLSSWIREAAVVRAREDSGAPTLADVRADLADIRRYLGAASRNLNQLTRHAHSGQLDPDRIRQTLDDLAISGAGIALALRDLSVTR